jgi:pimeloyl-ACP methyl ester carboxylesterase
VLSLPPRTLVPIRILRSLPLLLAAFLAVGCVGLTPYEEVTSRVPDENLVRIAGQTVYVEDVPARGGDAGAAAEPVVFLHGFGASSYSWRRVTGELAGYRTVALDLRGFGYTERPPGIEPYTRQAQIELVLAVMDALGIERANLVGHSYGGALAATLAVRHPERVRSLTLIDAAHPEYPQRRRTKLASVRPLTELFVRVRGLRPEAIRRALERSIHDDSMVTDELVAAYLDRLAIEHAPRAYYGITAPVDEPEQEVSLAQVEVPTLVLWGEADTLIELDDGRRAASVIPCHRFVAVPGAGHLPMEERPAEVAQALREFLPRPAAACDAP